MSFFDPAKMTIQKVLFLLWLLVPLALFAFHLGPGQMWTARDEAARQARRAVRAEMEEDWPAALEACTAALAKLPLRDRAERWALRLAQARARLHTGALPEALDEMDALQAEIQRLDLASPRLEDLRANIAAGEYYAAWLMRLEKAPVADWTAEANSARSHFRLLTRESTIEEKPAAREYQENLEATIRLSRMALGDLLKLPAPEFFKTSKDVTQKCRERRRYLASPPPEPAPPGTPAG